LYALFTSAVLGTWAIRSWKNGSEQENSHATEDELASCVCLSRWTSCRSSDARRFRL